MQSLLTFTNVAFVQTDGSTIRVKLGEVFNMFVERAAGEPDFIWTASKDPVLKVNELDAVTAEITATAPGTSKVVLLSEQLNKVFYLDFVVYDPAQAVTARVDDLGDRPRS